MKRLVAITALFAFLAGSAGASTVLVNGSFEEDDGLNGRRFTNLATPPGPSRRIFNALPGWTTVSGGGIEVRTNRSQNTVDAHDGQYYVELDSNQNSAMAQTVFLRVGRYDFRFRYAPRTRRTASNDIWYDVSGGNGSVFSGAVAGPSGAFPRHVWTEVVGEFTVYQAGFFDLTMGAGGTSDRRGGYINSVSLAPIPVPAGGLMLAGGLAGLAALRRRKASSQVAD